MFIPIVLIGALLIAAFLMQYLLPTNKKIKMKHNIETQTAVHEAGHVIVAYCCSAVKNIVSVSIVPDLNKKDSGITHIEFNSPPNWCDVIIALSGMVGEIITYGTCSYGAIEKDLIMAKRITKKLLLRKVPFTFDVPASQSVKFIGAFEDVEPEEAMMLEISYRMARHIIVSQQDKFHRLIALLLHHKICNESQLSSVLGSRIHLKLITDNTSFIF